MPNPERTRAPGRPRSDAPKVVRVVARLTTDEAIEVSRQAALEGITMGRLAHDRIVAPRSQAPLVSRRS